MEAVDTLSPDVGIRAACEAFGLSRATRYRYKTVQSVSSSDVLARPAPPRALSPDERQAVLDTLHCDRFIDLAPHEVYATLLDEGKYYCSIRTMYRILEDNREVKERRNQLRHPAYSKPELLATAPNQVWSWDITKLLGPVKWSYFYLYVILDIFSRYVVGWMIADRESAPLAKRLIYETCCKQSIEPGELTLHADRGSSMKSKPVALLLSDLGVTKTHSRPHTSDDNPFSESQFKTLKYRPAFPKRFGSIEDARAFSQGFFSWYNKEHHHTGIALLTPEIVHHGKAPDVLRERQNILFAAFKDHPERFVRKTPEPQILHEAVWINPPKDGLYTVAREGEAWSKASSKEAANQAAAERSPHIAERSGCRTQTGVFLKTELH